MLVGKVVAAQPALSEVSLSPQNTQLQLSSLTISFPEIAPSKKASSRSRVSPCNLSLQRSNEVNICAHAILGAGSYGIVYRASCHMFKSFALKVCHGKPNRLKKEWEVLCKCAQGTLNSHIPTVFFGAWSDADPTLLVIGMELCVPLTLHDYLMSENLNLGVSNYLAQEVAEAVAFVHSKSCIHRDIKLQNFVFSLDGRLKLIDFGVATDTLSPPAGDVTAGTLAFMSPEMASNVLCEKYNRVVVGAPADVWSLGAVLFCIFTQSDLYTDEADGSRTPGQDDVNSRLLRRVSKGEWRWPQGVSSTVPAQFKKLIESCMQLDPTVRPTMPVIMKDKIWRKRPLAPISVPQEIKSFLAVDSLSLDSEGSVKVEGASVRRSPVGRPLTPNSRGVALQADNNAVNALLSPLERLANPSSVHETPNVYRSLLTDVTTEGAHASEQGAPLITFSPSTFNADDALLGLLSPKSVVESKPLSENSTIATVEVSPSSHSPLSCLRLPKKLISDLLKDEVSLRKAIQSERNQIIDDFSSLFQCQQHNLKHPHRFRFHEKPIGKEYKEGYMCDACGVFYQPQNGWMPFFHCSCGSDLCEGCHVNFKLRCTCQNCQVSLENTQSLARHLLKCNAKILSRARSLGIKRERSQPLIADATFKHRDTTSPSLVPRGSKSINRGGVNGSLSGTETYALPTVLASSAPLVTEPVSLNPISTERLSEKDMWLPFASCKKTAQELSLAAKELLPTDEERASIVGESCDWVRYFHYYPEGVNAEALIYSIQPGRTGGIFLSNSSSIHSAIVAVVESKILIVDYVDTNTENDRIRVLSLEEGKRAQPSSVEILLEVVQRDTNLLKQRRSVGTMAQHQRQQTGLACFGEPFVYVRWVRKDLANRIDVFSLSNGAYQVFIQDQYEIRWLEGGRKFRIRAGGLCDLIDDETFNSIPALVAITQPM